MSEIKPLAVWLTREELLTVYAYQWVAWVYPAYGADQMTEEQRVEVFLNSLGEAMRWAIRELHHQGFRFEAIDVRADGTLYLTQPNAVCEENVILLGKLARKGYLSPVASILCALEEFEKRGLGIDTGPMKDVLVQAQSDALQARELIESDPDLVGAMDKAFDMALQSVGIVAIGRKELN